MDETIFTGIYRIAGRLMAHTRAAIIQWLVIIAIAIGLAGCGGDGGHSSPQEPALSANDRVSVSGRTAFDGASIQDAVIALGHSV